MTSKCTLQIRQVIKVVSGKGNLKAMVIKPVFYINTEVGAVVKIMAISKPAGRIQFPERRFMLVYMHFFGLAVKCHDYRSAYCFRVIDRKANKPVMTSYLNSFPLFQSEIFDAGR